MNMFPRDAKPLNTFQSAPSRHVQMAKLAEKVRLHVEVSPALHSFEKEVKEAIEAITAVSDRVFEYVRPEIRPVLERNRDAVVEALKQAASRESDMYRLAALQSAIERESEGVKFATQLFPGLAALQSRVKEIENRAGKLTELDRESLEFVSHAREDVERAIYDEKFKHCRPELQALFDELLYTEATGSGSLGLLSYGADLVEKADRTCIEAGRTAIQVCIGLNLDKAPPLSVFRERLSIGGYAPVMVVMPIGSFLMGSPQNDHETLGREKPQHNVKIDQRFAIGRYPVTFEEYDAYCKVTGSKRPIDLNWGRDRRPVINVSWKDANAYIAWLNKQLIGSAAPVYRLPSEAEWEYSCRAGTTTRYPWGDEWDIYRANNLDAEHKQTTETGFFPPNEWGLCDMAGNVWDWCADTHDDYSTPRVQAPHSIGVRTHVVRGSSWDAVAEYCRATFRGRLESDSRDDAVGFRLARGLP